MSEHLDETFDTQMEVERNPCGAWMAIQSQAAELSALRAKVAAMTAERDDHRQNAINQGALVTHWMNRYADRADAHDADVSRLIAERDAAKVRVKPLEWESDENSTHTHCPACGDEIKIAKNSDTSVCDATIQYGILAALEPAPVSDEALIRAALEVAETVLLECSVWCDSQDRTDDGWRNGVTDARKHGMAAIRALATPEGIAAIMERAKG